MLPADLYLNVISAVAACFLSLAFLRALLHKVVHYTEFTGTIHEYRLVPHRFFVPFAAVAVIASEACTTVGLILPWTRASAALLACGLLLFYAAAIGINLLRGRTSISCGCGGSREGISRLHVARNVFLTLCAIPAMASTSGGSMSLEVLAAIAGFVWVAWFLFLAFDQLLGNRMHAVATEYSPF